MLLITTNADNDATLTVRNPNIMSQIAELCYKSSIELLSLKVHIAMKMHFYSYYTTITIIRQVICREDPIMDAIYPLSIITLLLPKKL